MPPTKQSDLSYRYLYGIKYLCYKEYAENDYKNDAKRDLKALRDKWFKAFLIHDNKNERTRVYVEESFQSSGETREVNAEFVKSKE